MDTNGMRREQFQLRFLLTQYSSYSNRPTLSCFIYATPTFSALLHPFLFLYQSPILLITLHTPLLLTGTLQLCPPPTSYSVHYLFSSFHSQYSPFSPSSSAFFSFLTSPIARSCSSALLSYPFLLIDFFHPPLPPTALFSSVNPILARL